MYEISLSQITPADAFGASLDDQAKITQAQMVGWINFIACVQDKVLCTDSSFLTNPKLVQWLHDTDCNFLKNGILVPLLRHETIVNGKMVEVRDLWHLHEIFNEIEMYDPVITKDAESYLFANGAWPEIQGIHWRISDACKRSNSRIVRNPLLQRSFEATCSRAEVVRVTEKLGVEKDWLHVIEKVKAKNGGSIPGRKSIYNEARRLPRDHEIRRIADWISYRTMHVGLGERPTLDYPDHVTDFAIPMVSQQLPDLPEVKVREIDSVVRGITNYTAIKELAKIPPEKVLEIRDKHSRKWWKLRNEKDPHAKELADVFTDLYGAILQAQKDTQVGLSKAKMAIRIFDIAGVGIELYLGVIGQGDVTSYILQAGKLAFLASGHLVYEEVRKREARALGEKGISDVKTAISNIRKINASHQVLERGNNV